MVELECTPTTTYTVYPCGIDSSDQLPIATDLVTPVKGEVVNRLREAIIAIQAELGIQPSGTFTTVRARLDALELGGAGGGGGISTILKDGSAVSSNVTSINFLGDAVIIEDSEVPGRVNITLSSIEQKQETLTVTTNGQTAFTLSEEPADDTAVELYVNGVKQEEGVDYTVVDTALTYSGISLLTTDIFEVWYIVRGIAAGGGEEPPAGLEASDLENALAKLAIMNRRTGTLPADRAYHGDRIKSSGRLLVVGGDGAAWSMDDGLTWTAMSTGITVSALLNAVAIHQTSGVAFAVRDGAASATAYRVTPIPGSWTSLTLPNAPSDMNNTVWDPVTGNFVAVGASSGAGGYVVSSDDLAVSFTERTLPSAFTSTPLWGLAVSESGVIVATATTSMTKVIKSTNGGVSWSECTTTLDSGIYRVVYNTELNKFLAVPGTLPATLYTSSDGDTWSSVTPTGLHSLTTGLPGDIHVLGSLGRAFVMWVTTSINTKQLTFSFDEGVTWEHCNMDSATAFATMFSDYYGRQIVVGSTGTATQLSLRGMASPV